MVDRQFMLAWYNNFNSADLESETSANFSWLDVIPVDIRVKAIHRLYEVVVVPDQDVFFESTFMPDYYATGPTLDGVNAIYEALAVSASMNIKAIWLPDNYDKSIEAFPAGVVAVNDMIFESKILDIIVRSNELPRIMTKAHKFSGTVNAGSLSFFTILECEVL